MELIDQVSAVVADVEAVVPVVLKRPRGFAAMSPEKRKAISLLGVKKLHELGLAHKFNAEEAVEAGRKGGLSKVVKLDAALV